MMKIIYVILIIIVGINYSYQYLVFNFKTNIDPSTLNENNYMNMTFDQKLYVNFNLGDSHQIIPMTIKTQQLPTYVVSSCVSDNIDIKYNESESHDSFHKITSYVIDELYKYDFTAGCLVNDTLTLNSSLTYKNFTFMLATKINVIAKNISGEIGLSIQQQSEPQYIIPDRNKFLDQLKDNNLIKNKIFGIVYDTEYEGRLILGTYLHKLDTIYNENDMITGAIEDIKDKNRGKWHIDFNLKLIQGKYNEEIYLEEGTYGLIMYEIGLIIGSQSFRENFVVDYFKNRGCNETWVSSKPFAFYQYSCDTKEQFADFPDIVFDGPGKYIFNFTKDELFKKIGNQYIFQIVFEIINLEINYWRLGQTFFRKYNTFITWNEKQSTISYYPVKKVNNNYNKKLSSPIILIIILIIILVILIGVIIYFYFFCEKKGRKKRAMELPDEEYEYTQGEENNIQHSNKNLLDE